MVLLRIGSGQPEPSRCPRSTPDGFLALQDTQFGCMHAAAAPTVRSSVREWLIRSQSDSRFGLLHPRKSRNPCTPKMTSLVKDVKGNLDNFQKNRKISRFYHRIVDFFSNLFLSYRSPLFNRLDMPNQRVDLESGFGSKILKIDGGCPGTFISI